MSDSQTLVVKLGTSVLTGGSRRLNRAHIVELVRQCAQLHAAGHRIVIVTSGAIAAGREHLGYPELPATIASKQLLAAVGKADSFNSGNSCSPSMAFTSGRCC
jgi:glutamate 5-kinase